MLSVIELSLNIVIIINSILLILTWILEWKCKKEFNYWKTRYLITAIMILLELALLTIHCLNGGNYINDIIFTCILIITIVFYNL